MAKKREKLKPCPFCGGKAKLQEPSSGNGQAYVYCDCGVEAVGDYCSDCSRMRPFFYLVN